MSQTPLVSVIVAVRNGERFLADALMSVFAQDYRPLEVLVVDGQSADRTAQIALSFPEVIYIDQAGRGVADAYNLGISTAVGELIAFQSHDDLWTTDKLSTQVDHLLAHPNVQYCTASVKFFQQVGCALPAGFRTELLEGERPAHIMETLLAHKSVFSRVGTFDASLSTAEDVDWFARARDLKIVSTAIPRVLVHKRVHDANTSLTTSNNDRNLLQALRQSISRKRGGSSRSH